jgi:methylated-DNA-[protein]-cysteine S-methyltransferase
MSTITPHDPLTDALTQTPALDGQTWGRLRTDLARRAEQEGLLDVAFERHDSPLGSILVGATPTGVVRIGLPVEGEEQVLQELASRVSPRVLRSPRPAITQARRQLDEYFDRRRTTFDVPLDWQLTTGFRRQVLGATARIPYGQTRSYTQVATDAGSPKAVRAAGTALATNPLPILVPCHRVLRASGALGAYRGGPQAKAQLLTLEEHS